MASGIFAICEKMFRPHAQASLDQMILAQLLFKAVRSGEHL
jgi:hypothetical protein